MTAPPGRRGRDRGSAAVELTLLTPMLILLVLLVVAAGRLVEARLWADSAARQAARAATVSRSPSGAVLAARTTSAASGGSAAVCRPMTVNVDTRRFTPGGDVSVTVICTVHLADLIGLGLPGRTVITARATSTVDRYRAVTATGTP